MRRVDDDEPLQSSRGRCTAKFHATAPPQSCATSASTGRRALIDQRRDVGDQVLGAIGLDLGRRRRSLVAAQVRRDAAIASPKCASSASQTKARFGKAVQEDEHRRGPRRRAARQTSVMPCGSTRVEGLGSSAALGPRSARVRVSRRSSPTQRAATAASPTPGLLQRREQAHADVGLVRRRARRAPPARRRARRSLRCRLSLSALVSSTSSLTAPLPTRGATKSSRLQVEIGEAEARIDHQHDAGEAAPHLEVVGHHLLPAQLGAARHGGIAVARQIGEERVGVEPSGRARTG